MPFDTIIRRALRHTVQVNGNRFILEGGAVFVLAEIAAFTAVALAMIHGGVGQVRQIHFDRRLGGNRLGVRVQLRLVVRHEGSADHRGTQIHAHPIAVFFQLKHKAGIILGLVVIVVLADHLVLRPVVVPDILIRDMRAERIIARIVAREADIERIMIEREASRFRVNLRDALIDNEAAADMRHNTAIQLVVQMHIAAAADIFICRGGHIAVFIHGEQISVFRAACKRLHPVAHGEVRLFIAIREDRVILELERLIAGIELVVSPCAIQHHNQLFARDMDGDAFGAAIRKRCGEGNAVVARVGIVIRSGDDRAGEVLIHLGEQSAFIGAFPRDAGNRIALAVVVIEIHRGRFAAVEGILRLLCAERAAGNGDHRFRDIGIVVILLVLRERRGTRHFRLELTDDLRGAKSLGGDHAGFAVHIHNAAVGGVVVLGNHVSVNHRVQRDLLADGHLRRGDVHLCLAAVYIHARRGRDSHIAHGRTAPDGCIAAVHGDDGAIRIDLGHTFIIAAVGEIHRIGIPERSSCVVAVAEGHADRSIEFRESRVIAIAHIQFKVIARGIEVISGHSTADANNAHHQIRLDDILRPVYGIGFHLCGGRQEDIAIVCDLHIGEGVRTNLGDGIDHFTVAVLRREEAALHASIRREDGAQAAVILLEDVLPVGAGVVRLIEGDALLAGVGFCGAAAPARHGQHILRAGFAVRERAVGKHGAVIAEERIDRARIGQHAIADGCAAEARSKHARARKSTVADAFQIFVSGQIEIARYGRIAHKGFRLDTVNDRGQGDCLRAAHRREQYTEAENQRNDSFHG